MTVLLHAAHRLIGLSRAAMRESLRRRVPRLRGTYAKLRPTRDWHAWKGATACDQPSPPTRIRQLHRYPFWISFVFAEGAWPGCHEGGDACWQDNRRDRTVFPKRDFGVIRWTG